MESMTFLVPVTFWRSFKNLISDFKPFELLFQQTWYDHRLGLHRDGSIFSALARTFFKDPRIRD